MIKETEDKILDYCTYAAIAIVLCIIIVWVVVLSRDRALNPPDLPQTAQNVEPDNVIPYGWDIL